MQVRPRGACTIPGGCRRMELGLDTLPSMAQLTIHMVKTCLLLTNPETVMYLKPSDEAPSPPPSPPRW